MLQTGRPTFVTTVAVAAALLACLVGCPQQQAAEETTPPEPPPQQAAGDQAGTTEEGQDMGMTITSTAFKQGERIPVKYTADGESISPPLQWTGVPENTQSLVLVCHDPDAPRAGGFTHWVVYAIEPSVTGLPENMPKTTGGGGVACMQGMSDARQPGYRGPSPPPGKPHRYQFTLYALSTGVLFEVPPDRATLLDAIKDHITAQTTLEGLYGR